MTGAAPVICIDGPSGAGKGTPRQRVATDLGWHLLDSGALFRVVGFAGRLAAVSLEDSDAVAGIARSLDVDFDFQSNLRLALPETREFLTADLTADPTAALEEAETNQGQ